MKVTQSKKTGKFSLTQLTEKDLVNLHNTLEDITTRYSIRLALLELHNADIEAKNEALEDEEQEEKLTDEVEIEEFWTSKGLKL